MQGVSCSGSLDGGWCDEHEVLTENRISVYKLYSIDALLLHPCL